MVLEKKGSARVEAGQRRVLDEATRQRRLTRQLEALEKDNFQDDPLSSLPPPGPTARLPAFSETEEPEEEEDEGRPLQTAFQEELHHTAGGGEPVGEAGAELPVGRGSALLSAPPSLLLRLRFPLPLHLHHLWGALLQQQVSGDAPRDQVFEVDALTAASSTW
ncbi:zinc finger HIT domain-containing protein 1 isoform 1-T1 [Symphorus nematophorus]